MGLDVAMPDEAELLDHLDAVRGTLAECDEQLARLKLLLAEREKMTEVKRTPRAELSRMSPGELIDRIEDLEYLTAEMTTQPEWATYPILPDLPLTNTERRLLVALHQGGGRCLSHANLLAAMNAHRPECDWPEVKIVDVYVCHLRRKLEGTGLRIENKRGIGYRLVSEARPALGEEEQETGQ